MEIETVIIKSLTDSKRQENRYASKMMQLEGSLHSHVTNSQFAEAKHCQKIEELENEIRRLKTPPQNKRNTKLRWPYQKKSAYHKKL